VRKHGRHGEYSAQVVIPSVAHLCRSLFAVALKRVRTKFVRVFPRGGMTLKKLLAVLEFLPEEGWMVMIRF
jgi:hypothetical protein